MFFSKNLHLDTVSAVRCQTTIHRQLGLTDAELVGSTLAAKVNAFLAGFFYSSNKIKSKLR
jgi:hypothetical protein